MNIVQSFWSKPFFKEKKDRITIEFLLMSWALSSLQLRKFYDEAFLYTDQKGKE
jgi:hypothetical protein